MASARWFVIAFLVVAGFIGTTLNEHGPFEAHSRLSYEQFLDDYGAGRIPLIVQWRDQLEVTWGDELRTVVVPEGRDLFADLQQTGWLGASGYSAIADQWLGLHTPAVPILILVAAVLTWSTGIVRNHRPQPRPA